MGTDYSILANIPDSYREAPLDVVGFSPHTLAFLQSRKYATVANVADTLDACPAALIAISGCHTVVEIIHKLTRWADSVGYGFVLHKPEETFKSVGHADGRGWSTAAKTNAVNAATVAKIARENGDTDTAELADEMASNATEAANGNPGIVPPLAMIGSAISKAGQNMVIADEAARLEQEHSAAVTSFLAAERNRRSYTAEDVERVRNRRAQRLAETAVGAPELVPPYRGIDGNPRGGIVVDSASDELTHCEHCGKLAGTHVDLWPYAGIHYRGEDTTYLVVPVLSDLLRRIDLTLWDHVAHCYGPILDGSPDPQPRAQWIGAKLRLIDALNVAAPNGWYFGQQTIADTLCYGYFPVTHEVSA